MGLHGQDLFNGTKGIHWLMDSYSKWVQETMFSSFYNIRIFIGCEVRIENSHYGFFFLHILPSSTAFKLKCVLFCQFYAKISTFLVKISLVWLLPSTLML